MGECLADHAAVDVVAAGDLPDGYAAGGVRRDRKCLVRVRSL